MVWVKCYSQCSQFECLYVELILQVVVDQCKGCCGCIGLGICYCLYDEVEFVVCVVYIDLELLCFLLVNVILCMLVLKLGEVDEFFFFEVFDLCVIVDGYCWLVEILVIDDKCMFIVIGCDFVCLLIDV